MPKHLELLNKIVVLPEGTEIPRSKGRTYTSQKSAEKLNRIILDYAKITYNWTSDDKINFLLKSIMNISKSQGIYLSYTEMKDDVLKFLICKYLMFSEIHGDPKDILQSDNLPIGSYFPMKKGMLHFEAAKQKNIIICNSAEYLSGHKCPGFIIHNVMYYPLFFNHKLIALICICNRKGGYNLDIIKYILPLIRIISGIVGGVLKYRSLETSIRDQVLNEIKYEHEKSLSYYIINKSKEIGIVIDNDFRIMSISNAAKQELKPFIKDRVIQRGQNLLSYSQFDTIDQIITHFKKALVGEELPIIHHFTQPLSDNIHYFDCWYAPIYEEHQIMGAYMLGKNLTTIMALQENLRIAKEEAEYANKMKDQYLSRMSHELRTPLNSIIGFAQLIQSSTKGMEENAKYILSGGDHLLNMVNEILDISAIESGKFHMSIETVNIEEIIKLSINLLSGSNKSNISVINQVDRPILIKADFHRVQQVIINVLSNAMKYNKIDGTITFSYQVQEEYLIIKIKDTGIGISPEYMKNLFVPFDRCGIAGEAIEGTGLGLCLCKKLIEGMNGKIKISSEKNVGTQVDLYFVLNENQDVENYQPQVSDEDLTITTDDNLTSSINRNVLYIEDNTSNYKLMESIFSNYLPYKLITANLGTRGYELAESVKIDLIILDLGLPDISGEELLIKFKKNPKLSDIPVIVNSAYSSDHFIEKIKNLGADYYVTKPFKVKYLISLIQKLLN